MLRYLLGRLLSGIPVLLGVSVVAFVMLYLMPGDPVRVLLSSFDASQMSEEDIDAIRESYGLNDPLPVQFIDFILNMFKGDLGDSVLSGRPVTTLIAEAIPHTLLLALAGITVSTIAGITIGVFAAIKHRTWFDSGAMMTSLFGVSMPDFWLAILSILIFAETLQLLPSSGTTGWQSLVLPALVLGIRSSAAIARLTRSSMLDVLSRQYMTTASAKGLGRGYVISVHALKNALIPVVTLLGLQFGRLLGSAVVVEVVFARRGIGSLLVDAILSADVMVVRGTILIIGVSYFVINLIVDMSYSWLDPRIRLST